MPGLYLFCHLHAPSQHHIQRNIFQLNHSWVWTEMKYGRNSYLGTEKCLLQSYCYIGNFWNFVVYLVTKYISRLQAIRWLFLRTLSNIYLQSNDTVWGWCHGCFVCTILRIFWALLLSSRMRNETFYVDSVLFIVVCINSNCPFNTFFMCRDPFISKILLGRMCTDMIVSPNLETGDRVSGWFFDSFRQDKVGQIPYRLVLNKIRYDNFLFIWQLISWIETILMILIIIIQYT